MKINTYQLTYDPMGLSESYTPDFSEQQVPFGDNIVYDKHSVMVEYSFDMVLLNDEINDITGMLEQSRLCHMDFDEMHGFFYVKKFDKTWVKMIDDVRIASYTVDGYYLGHRPYLKLSWFHNHHKTDYAVPVLNETLVPVDYVSRISQQASYELWGTDGGLYYFDSPPGKIKFKADDDIFMNGCIHANTFDNTLDMSTYTNWFTQNVSTGGDTKGNTAGFYRIEGERTYVNYTNLLSVIHSTASDSTGYSIFGQNTSENLLPSSCDAENGLVNQVGAQGSCTISNSTDYAYLGTHSFKCITGNVATNEGLLMYPMNQVNPSSGYSGGAFVRGSGTVYAVIQCYDFRGNWLRQMVGSPVTLSSSWQRIYTSQTLGSDVYQTLIGIITSTKQAATFYVDCLSFNRGLSIHNYMSGTTPATEFSLIKAPVYQKRIMYLNGTPVQTDYLAMFNDGITDVIYDAGTAAEFSDYDTINTHITMAHSVGLKIHVALNPWYKINGATFLDPGVTNNQINTVNAYVSLFSKCPGLDGATTSGDYFYPGMWQNKGDAAQRATLNSVCQQINDGIHGQDPSATWSIMLNDNLGLNSAYLVDLRNYTDFIIADIPRGWDDSLFAMINRFDDFFNIAQKNVTDEVTWILPLFSTYGDPANKGTTITADLIQWRDMYFLGKLNGAGYVVSGWPYTNAPMTYQRLAVEGEESIGYITSGFSGSEGIQYTDMGYSSGGNHNYSTYSLGMSGTSVGTMYANRVINGTHDGTWKRWDSGYGVPSGNIFSSLSLNSQKTVAFIDKMMVWDGYGYVGAAWIPGQETNRPYAIIGDNTLFGADSRLVYDTNTKYNGLGSIRVDCIGTGGNEGVAFVGENLTPGLSYTASLKVYAPNLATYNTMATDGANYTAINNYTGTGGWQTVTQTGSVQSNGLLYFLVYYPNNTIQQSIAVDYLMLNEGVTPLPTWTPSLKTLTFRPMKDQVYYNKKTDDDIVINNKLFYFQFHKGDPDKSCSIYDYTGRKVLILSDETDNVLSDDFNMELDPFETIVETGNSKYTIKLGMEFFELSSIGTPIRYPQKRFAVATSPFCAYGYQEAIQIQSSTMVLDRSLSIYPSQINYSETPSFMHWTPTETVSFETITSSKNVHPSDGFNDETYKNFIGISGFTPQLYTSTTATCLNMTRPTDGATYGGTANYNKGKYGSRNSWYIKNVNGMKYTVYGMINNSSNSLGSSFDFWIDGVTKGIVTVGAGTYSRFVHLGDYIANGATQTFTFTPKDKTTYTGFHYILIVPKSGGFSWDSITSTSPYRLRELALSDIKMSFEVGD